MFWYLIENYMPRGLYGRAALILILPVLTLQLLISVVFIQRHFDGVTWSMTSAVNIELRFLRDLINESPDIQSAVQITRQTATALEVVLNLPSKNAPLVDETRFFD